jgi:hypothetical protein
MCRRMDLLSVLKHFISWFAGREAPVRASLIGAIATLAAIAGAFYGTIKTLRWNRQKHKEDSELSLRKDIILEASDVLAGVVQFLSTLHLPDVKIHEGGDVMRRFAGALGKIHIATDRPTREVVMRVSHQILTCYTALSVRKVKLESTKALAENYRDSINRATGERQQLLDLDWKWRENTDERQHWIERIETLNGQIAFCEAEADSLETENARYWFETIEESRDQMLKLSPIMVEIIATFRSALRLEPDREWHNQQMEPLLKQALANSNEILETVRPPRD